MTSNYGHQPHQPARADPRKFAEGALGLINRKLTCGHYQVDFNVPLDGETITNPQRIVAALPTVKYAIAEKAKAIILMSHLGRPDGKRIEKFSLNPVAKELEALLGTKVTFLSDCVGKEVEEHVQKASNGEGFCLIFGCCAKE